MASLKDIIRRRQPGLSEKEATKLAEQFLDTPGAYIPFTEGDVCTYYYGVSGSLATPLYNPRPIRYNLDMVVVNRSSPVLSLYRWKCCYCGDMYMDEKHPPSCTGCGAQTFNEVTGP